MLLSLEVSFLSCSVVAFLLGPSWCSLVFLSVFFLPLVVSVVFLMAALERVLGGLLLPGGSV